MIEIVKKSRERMTPKKAHKIVKDLAKKANLSMRKYCESRGVQHSTVSRWKTKPTTSNFSLPIFEALTR